MNALAPVAQVRPEDRGKGFLDKLEDIWTKDAGRAVLLARWFWERLPEELVQQAAMLQAQVRLGELQRGIGELVAPWLGSGRRVPGFETMTPDHAAFITIMSNIRMCRGESACPEQAQLAEAVLRGQVDPVDALVAATPAVNRQQVAMQVQSVRMMGRDQLLRFSGIIAAASALPRERIPVLIAELQLQKRSPQPSSSPDPELLKLTGRWKGSMSRYELVRDNGGYRVTVFNLFGCTIGKGQATINGSTLTLTVKGFAGTSTADLRLKGDRLQGVGRVFGALSLPFTLRRA